MQWSPREANICITIFLAHEWQKLAKTAYSAHEIQPLVYHTHWSVALDCLADSTRRWCRMLGMGSKLWLLNQPVVIFGLKSWSNRLLINFLNPNLNMDFYSLWQNWLNWLQIQSKKFKNNRIYWLFWLNLTFSMDYDFFKLLIDIKVIFFRKFFVW